MSGDLAPILLRPSAALADAMTAAAAECGISRQAWMLAVLTDASADHFPDGAHPDDLPLFTLTTETPS